MIAHLRPEAHEDLKEAAAWYERQRPGLGGELLDEILRTLALIEENPELYPVVHEDVRRAVTRRFPFGIFYVVGQTAISVLAVMHSTRDPSRWQTRT